MNELKIFENEEFGEVRTVIIEGEPWFVGKDVAEILGYGNYRQALKTNIDDDDKDVQSIDTLGGKQNMVVINESGLYCLVISSKLPSAKKFRKWITSVVIPSIRKNGGYITSNALNDIIYNPKNLQLFLSAMQKINDENIELKSQIDELEPKADYFDKMMNSELLINFRNLAKELQIKQNELITILLNKKYLYRDKKERLLPYQKYMDLGYFEVIEFTKNNHSGIQTLITPKGRNHILQSGVIFI